MKTWNQLTTEEFLNHFEENESMHNFDFYYFETLARKEGKPCTQNMVDKEGDIDFFGKKIIIDKNVSQKMGILEHESCSICK